MSVCVNAGMGVLNTEIRISGVLNVAVVVVIIMTTFLVVVVLLFCCCFVIFFLKTPA